MWPLIVKFFTLESYAIRLIRFLGVVGGTLVAAGNAPEFIPDWAGYIIAGVAAALSGTDKTPSGIPKAQP